MLKNMTSTQLLLTALAGVLLLMIAFSLILLQNPSALPARATATTPLPSSTQVDIIQPSATPVPTRQTTYTPFATLLTQAGSTSPATLTSGTISPNPSQTLMPGTPSASLLPSITPNPLFTRTPGTPSITPSPLATNTLSPGEIDVTGRVLINGTPVANVLVEFKDDVAPRKASTNQNGAYHFITLAPGNAYRLTFYQSDNPQLTPTKEIASLAWLEGMLPINTNPIALPGLDVSLNLNGALFELQIPLDGSNFSASVISSNNPIQFAWSLYSSGGSYHIELGQAGSTQPLWSSRQIPAGYFMWDGTLNDGSHVTAGTYWWRVAITLPAGNYTQDIFTQPLNIVFTP